MKDKWKHNGGQENVEKVIKRLRNAFDKFEGQFDEYQTDPKKLQVTGTELLYCFPVIAGWFLVFGLFLRTL